MHRFWTNPGDESPRGRTDLAAAWLGLVFVALGCGGVDVDPRPSFPPSDYDAAGATPAADPLVGTNYTHHSFEECSWVDGGILDTYRRPGVAEVVHHQLRQMRLSGVASLRLLIWHMRDVPRQHWGVVPSRGGRLPAPFRGNLIAYLAEVRDYGFRRLTVSFSPQWANNPRDDRWEEERFSENWAFIRDVRSLVLRHGPADVRFDLLNEGAPSDHSPPARRARVMDYVGRMWRRYDETFGVDDATVSVIAPRTAWDRGHRLENLVSALGEGGTPLPPWFELHLNYGPEGVAWGLRSADSVLTARGLHQPLTIGETSYDDAAVGQAIGAFVADSERPLAEVIQWYKRAGEDCEVPPPYGADAYLRLDGEIVGYHRRAYGSGNSSASSASASATVSGLGSSGSSPDSSGRAVPPELLMR